MTDRNSDLSGKEEIPFFQRLFDRPFLWLALGMVTMVAFYTGWGILELMTMTKAPLP